MRRSWMPCRTAARLLAILRLNQAATIRAIFDSPDVLAIWPSGDRRPAIGETGRVDEQTRARRAACSEFVNGDGLVQPHDQLASIGTDVTPDVYGDGGVVTDLERYIADLL